MFVKAKIKQRKTVLATTTAHPIKPDHPQCSCFFQKSQSKLKPLASNPPEVMTTRTDVHHTSPVPRNPPDGSVEGIQRSSKGNRAAGSDLLSSFRPIRDSLQTETSILQDEAMHECLPFLAGVEKSEQDGTGRTTGDLPRLQRAKHIDFLHQCLEELPAAYVGFDASRPWIVYWALAGLSLLGEDVRRYRER